MSGPFGPSIGTNEYVLSGINEELMLVLRKAERGALRRHVEALEDTKEIMDSYRRIQGHLERLTVRTPTASTTAEN